MSRYPAMFKRLAQEKAGAFVPFVTIGDPDIDTSLAIIDTLVDAGADALELGIPFSDPLADGPTIQAATSRALGSGVTPAQCFKVLTQVRAKYPELPIGLLMYANLVFTNGIDHFYQQCQQAGVDSVLVADVPLQMAKEFRQAAQAHEVDPIFICPPDADDETLRELATRGRGYTYLLARAGVTGAEVKGSVNLDHLIAKLTEYNAAPPLLGFGVSAPEQVHQAIANGAAGAISGSAIVKIIEQNHAIPEQLHAKLHDFVSHMKAASFHDWTPH